MHGSSLSLYLSPVSLYQELSIPLRATKSQGLAQNAHAHFPGTGLASTWEGTQCPTPVLSVCTDIQSPACAQTLISIQKHSECLLIC